MVTVAVRRVNLDRATESLLDFIDPERYFLLPNTAGCYTAEEAIRAARLGREVGLSDWVKIEVIGDLRDAVPGRAGDGGGDAGAGEGRVYGSAVYV